MALSYKAKVKGYRIANVNYPIFSSKGARVRGGRWNPIGSEVIYASEHLSLSLLELRVHLHHVPLPASYQYVEFFSREEVSCEKVESQGFNSWDINDRHETQNYGRLWLKEQRSLILFIPSIILPHEYNMVINPAHFEFSLLIVCKPQPLAFDTRLF
jgi:RES domain-containing protein